MAMQQQREEALEVFDIELQVLSGRKLPSKDIGGKSDPFIKISIADETVQTKVIKNSLNPSWNETFSFRFFSNPKSIRFDVMDEDKVSDDKMGIANFNISTLLKSASRTFEGNLKLEGGGKKNKGSLQVRITAVRFTPRAQNELITKQGEVITQHKETIARQQRTISQQKEQLTTQSTRIDQLTVSVAQMEAQAMSQSQAQPGRGSGEMWPGSAAVRDFGIDARSAVRDFGIDARSAVTKKLPTQQIKIVKKRAVTKMKATSATMKTGFYVGLEKCAALWQILLTLLYSVPLVDEVVLALGSMLRLGSGLTVFTGATTSKRPTKVLKLYERENCVECKMVRETLSSLDLDCVIYPVPEGQKGEETRFGAEAQRLGGSDATNATNAFPVLVDENYGDDGPLILLGSAQIIQNLFDEYGNNVTLSLMDRVRAKVVQSALMTMVFGAYLSVFRAVFGAQRNSKAKGVETVQPAQMLELWSYEASPFCVKVREVLCALEIPFVLKNVAHGSEQKRGEFQIRFGKKYPAWKQKVGALQLPLLIDANTATELFKVGEIEKYLNNTYCASA